MYPSYSNRRRSRRVLVALVLVSVVALLFIAAGNLRSETRALVAYLEAARSAALEHADQSAEFREQVLAGMADLTRDRLMTVMAGMVETSDQVSAELQQQEVPAAAADPAAALSLALASWHAGLEGFETALLAVVDNPESAVTVGDLASVLIDLEVGDRAYARFVEVADELRGEADVELGQFPNVGYLSAALSSFTYAERLATTAGRASGLALSRDLAIATVRLDPPATGGETDGAPILPFTETLLFQVVVVNEGNRDETDLTVSLLLENGSGELVLEESTRVAELVAGASMTIEFADIPITAGENHLATIAVAAIDGEDDTDNNSLEVLFFVNEPA